MRITHFRPMKRDKQAGNKARALARAMAQELRQAGNIVIESVKGKGEYVTSVKYETVQDLAYKLAEGQAQYSTANLSIFETE